MTQAKKTGATKNQDETDYLKEARKSVTAVDRAIAQAKTLIKNMEKDDDWAWAKHSAKHMTLTRNLLKDMQEIVDKSEIYAHLSLYEDSDFKAQDNYDKLQEQLSEFIDEVAEPREELANHCNKMKEMQRVNSS